MKEVAGSLVSTKGATLERRKHRGKGNVTLNNIPTRKVGEVMISWNNVDHGVSILATQVLLRDHFQYFVMHSLDQRPDVV
jgi:hypothetical protein